eukprot:CAMPEP_0196576094 /NCGR_PEP_ID=MMETSP1081-20130531/5443_1 /TAXON_ID=36882 /ORGANISM="Pyramimonas amylifera, Strain CCMP720" /LENGTH=276 /DNA_ID=CAMNT_0041894605 /DNA_START=142 /DNA_END=969 /DNA_ORIENTATION=+
MLQSGISGKVRAAEASKPSKNNIAKGLPPQELLEDLSIRFVINAPQEELQSFDRILFLVEQAHWFYEDNVRDEQKNYKSLSLREFTEMLFCQCACLQPYQKFVDDIYKRFNQYKHTVPVFGGILLNPTMTHILLVRGFTKQSSWGFPKGKVNAEEEGATCARREVAEETGFLCQPHEEHYIELTRGQQLSRLYIIPGVPEETHFEPQTKGEIGKIEWFPISSFTKTAGENDNKKFFMVHPFIGHLKRWVKTNRKNLVPLPEFASLAKEQYEEAHPW